jgi:hypothetical protein
MDPDTRKKVNELVKEFSPDWAGDRRIEFLNNYIVEHIFELWDLQHERLEAIRKVNPVQIAWTDEEIHAKDKQIRTLFREASHLMANHTSTPRKNELGADLIERAREYPITELITFNRAGFALCPWHEENTPSLHRIGTSNRVYCFGCHESADPIKWIMDTEGLSFPDAVRRLAR